MIESLKFVKNGYDKSELNPQLSSFCIRDKRVTAFNGTLAMSAPVDIAKEFYPDANHFYKCIAACDEKMSFTLEKGKVKIKSGKFKATVACQPTPPPSLVPRGTRFKFESPVLEKIKSLIPIIDEKSPRVWSHGMCFRGESVFVTDNVLIVEQWLGQKLPSMLVPKKILSELCKNGEEPASVLVSDDMIFFMLPGDKWMGSKLLVNDFPNVNKYVEIEGDYDEVPDEFWDALVTINKFADEAKKVFFGRVVMSTHASADAAGASVECDCPELGIFNSEKLLSLKGLATHFDFCKYPGPVPFIGEELRGVILGYRDV